jgi:hypothetical protein
MCARSPLMVVRVRANADSEGPATLPEFPGRAVPFSCRRGHGVPNAKPWTRQWRGAAESAAIADSHVLPFVRVSRPRALNELGGTHYGVMKA